MREPDTNMDTAETTALRALTWVVAEEARTERFLALTGIDPATLRARAGDPAILGAVLAHLEQHEPDLIACADSLGIAPAALIAARDMLDRA